MLATVALRPVVSRFPPDIADAMAVEAARRGVSLSEFVKTGAIAWLAVANVSRNAHSAAAISALYDAAEDVVRAWREDAAY